MKTAWQNHWTTKEILVDKKEKRNVEQSTKTGNIQNCDVLESFKDIPVQIFHLEPSSDLNWICPIFWFMSKYQKS